MSTTDAARVCMLQPAAHRTVCGRKPERGHQTSTWNDVNCADCRAAHNAGLTEPTNNEPASRV